MIGAGSVRVVGACDLKPKIFGGLDPIVRVGLGTSERARAIWVDGDLIRLSLRNCNAREADSCLLYTSDAADE